MTKPMEYSWHVVRVVGGNVTGFSCKRVGQVSAPCWLDAMQRAIETFGGDYGGLTVLAV